MKYDCLSVRYDGNVAVVTLCRPPVNALSSEAWGEISQAFYDLGQDPELRAVILTAECDKKLFVGGTDVTAFLSLDAESGERFTLRNNDVRFQVYRCPVPVICALNGSAFGGGLGLALMCDYRITVPEAKFAVGEINMGILGFTQFLAARVHNGAARKMVYGGVRLEAQEALQVGLVDEVVTQENLLPRAKELADRFAAQSPLAVRKAKECMLKAESYIFELGGQAFEDARIKELWATEDQKEATRAFLEKRSPEFKGR